MFCAHSFTPVSCTAPSCVYFLGVPYVRVPLSPASRSPRPPQALEDRLRALAAFLEVAIARRQQKGYGSRTTAGAAAAGGGGGGAAGGPGAGAGMPMGPFGAPFAYSGMGVGAGGGGGGFGGGGVGMGGGGGGGVDDQVAAMHKRRRLEHAAQQEDEQAARIRWVEPGWEECLRAAVGATPLEWAACCVRACVGVENESVRACLLVYGCASQARSQVDTPRVRGQGCGGMSRSSLVRAPPLRPARVPSVRFHTYTTRPPHPKPTPTRRALVLRVAEACSLLRLLAAHNLGRLALRQLRGSAGAAADMNKLANLVGVWRVAG